MNVKELKEWLDEFDDDLEVRIASQPHYPMQYDINGVTLYQDPKCPCDTCEE